jgi:hypothetical protein
MTRDQLEFDVKTAREMLESLGDIHQRDETILFIRQAEMLLAKNEITEEDFQILREHY